MEEKEEKLEVKVGPLAYKKIIYHLVRYPTSKVTGTSTLTQASSPAAAIWRPAMPTPSSTLPSSTPLSAWLWT